MQNNTKSIFKIIIAISFILVVFIFALVGSGYYQVDNYIKSVAKERIVIGQDLLKNSNYLKLVTIAVEDSRFYSRNNTCNPILEAVFCKGECKYSSSNITIQIVKNIYMTPDRHEYGKLMFLPCEIERILSKDQLLELYLSGMRYSEKSIGVKSASLEFFNKDVSELNLAESVMLASLPQAPLYFTQNKGNWLEKSQNILKNMLDEKYISQDEYTEAINYISKSK